MLRLWLSTAIVLVTAVATSVRADEILPQAEPTPIEPFAVENVTPEPVQNPDTWTPIPYPETWELYRNGYALYLNVEATWLAPNFHGGRTDVTFTDVLGGSSTTITNASGESQYLGFAPRFSAGLVGWRCWGLQVRYWQVDTSGSVNDPVDPTTVLVDPTGFTAFSDFKARALDIELTRDFSLPNWNFVGTFGLRYGGIEHSQSFSSTAIYPLGGPIDFYFANSLTAREFNGVGITYSIGGVRRITDWYGDLGFYWTARGSVLWGDNKSIASNGVSLSGPGIAAFSFARSATDVSDDLLTGEVQFGLQWSRAVQTFNGRVFARAGFEYQHWSADNTATGAFSTLSRVGISELDIATTRGSLSVDMLGFGIATGFVW